MLQTTLGDRLKIVYVYHDCFILEIDDRVVVFDYPSNIKDREIEFVKSSAKNKTLILLFSHSHADHFNPNFSTLREGVRNFQCIVSYDILESYGELIKRCIVVEPGDQLSISNFKVKVFGSSDQGVSYVLEISDVLLYFAGDNGNWVRDELPEELSTMIKSKFIETINQIARCYRSIDIVFTPICIFCEDLGGVRYVSEKLKPKLLIPMHLRGQIQILNKIAPLLKELARKVFVYEKLGDEIHFK